MTPLIHVYWGGYGLSHIPASDDTGGWVPDTEAWWLLGAAVSIDDPNNVAPVGDYMLLDDTRYPPTGALWYLTGLQKALQTNTTPVLSLARPYLLMPGHRLSVRTNVFLPSTVRMGLHATGLRIPIAYLPTFLRCT